MDQTHLDIYRRLDAVGCKVLDAKPLESKDIRADLQQYHGKALSDLADPAWEMVSGTAPFQYAGALWRPYSTMDSEKAYRANSVIHSCSRAIVHAVCEPRLMVVARMGKEEKEVENHPLLEVLETPNPFYSRNETLAVWALRRLLTGVGYLWKWRTQSRSRIAQLWPLPSSWIRVRAGHGAEIIHSYEITQLGGGRQIVDAVDMVRTGMVDPSTMLENVAPLAAAQHEYQLDMERQDYVVEMLTNMHVPGLKYKLKRRLVGTSRDELRQALEDRTGIGKRGSVMLIDPDEDAELMEPLKDFDWPNLDSLTESRICAAFGVPPILIGLRVGLEHATYANYGIARRSFYTETLKPLWTALEDSLTLSLCRQEGDMRSFIKFDLSEITELQEDLDARADRAEKLYKAQLMTKDEARALVDLSPATDGSGEKYAEKAAPEPFGAEKGAGVAGAQKGGVDANT